MYKRQVNALVPKLKRQGVEAIVVLVHEGGFPTGIYNECPGISGPIVDIVNRLVRGNPLSRPRDFLIPNAGINWISARNDCWDLEAWGETEHLAMVGLDELP